MSANIAALAAQLSYTRWRAVDDVLAALPHPESVKVLPYAQAAEYLGIPGTVWLSRLKVPKWQDGKGTNGTYATFQLDVWKAVNDPTRPYVELADEIDNKTNERGRVAADYLGVTPEALEAVKRVIATYGIGGVTA